MPISVRGQRRLAAVMCSLLLVPVTARPARAQEPATASTEQAPEIPNDQLDSLVAPIALYPDPLLAQVLAASTYPLEIVQLQQWLLQNKDLKGDALTAAVEKQDWDPSVQGLAALPDAVKLLSEDIKWTTDLGNAFLAQQGDVMDAVQRMRVKAKNAGALKSSPQMKVETKAVESQTVVVIEQANPEVVYVPSYNPTVVYGPPAYPYPPVSYPPPAAYAGGMLLSFGVGMAVGAAFHGGWGYDCGWGGGGNNNININNNNNFVKNSANRPGGQGGQRAQGGSGQWQHNPQHRGGAPYANQGTANKYGGTTRDASASQRQAAARQQQERSGSRQQGGAGGADQGRGGGGMDRGGGADRGGGGAGRGGGGADRGGGGVANMQPSGGGRGGGGAVGGGDRVGNHSVSPSTGSRGGGGALGGGSGGSYSGGSARASSSRGSSSTGGRSGGGGGGGGGGRGGGGGGRGGGRR